MFNPIYGFINEVIMEYANWDTFDTGEARHIAEKIIELHHRLSELESEGICLTGQEEFIIFQREEQAKTTPRSE